MLCMNVTLMTFVVVVFVIWCFNFKTSIRIAGIYVLIMLVKHGHWMWQWTHTWQTLCYPDESFLASVKEDTKS